MSHLLPRRFHHYPSRISYLFTNVVTQSIRCVNSYYLIRHDREIFRALLLNVIIFILVLLKITQT